MRMIFEHFYPRMQSVLGFHAVSRHNSQLPKRLVMAEDVGVTSEGPLMPKRRQKLPKFSNEDA
jgi:hypothetical protein